LLTPPHKKVPSEATVEQVANHQLLNLIGPHSSWFYVPTRNEENALGYDASLQGKKALVIQYKRFQPVRHGPGGSIRITSAQHATLMRNFPMASQPYVFYGFCSEQTYGDFAANFTGGAGWTLGSKLLFLDAHSISPPPYTLSWSTLSASAISLFKLALLFQRCTIGAWIEQSDGRWLQPEHRRKLTPHTHVLIGSIPRRAA
jgi:hypothetical protein